MQPEEALLVPAFFSWPAGIGLPAEPRPVGTHA